MASEASAFCPGHVTAFFEVVDHEDPFRKGSRGAGLCLSLGVRTTVKARRARKQRIRVFLNRQESEAVTTGRVLERMIDREAYDVVVQSRVPLPQSQGFGMSAAGALSTALAANEALGLGLPRDRLIAIAHAAEVEAKTGLGDVVPASLGGMDLRAEPGAPPHGVVRRFPVDAELLLAVLGPPLPTRAVLADAAKARTISEVGRQSVLVFSRSPDVDALFRVGREFATRTGLADGKLREAMEAVAPYGKASMSMLGNGVFTVGQVAQLDAILKGLGAQRYRCQVEGKGARIL